MDNALQNILVSKDVISKHPGYTDVSSWYPSASETRTHLSEAVNSSGRLRVTSNSLSFGASSNFTISTSSLLYGLTLNATLTTPANSVIAYDGWLFDCIQTVEFTLSNSVIQNQTLSGIAMRDYLLSTCKDQDERNSLLKTGGQPVGTATQASASIPLAWLLQAGDGICSHFPIDMATLNGSMQVQITFYPSSYILSRTGAAPETINTFDSLVLTTSTTDIVNPALSVRSVMLQNPGMTYPIPCKYLNSVRYTQSCTLGQSTTLNLNSAPSGMLEAICLVVKPSVERTANADGTVNYPGGVELSALALQFGGTDLFRANSLSEIESYYRTKFCGDDMSYQYRFQSGNTVNAANADIIAGHAYLIPLSYEAQAVMSYKKQENLPSYGGSNLQLSFTPTARVLFDSSAGPYFPTGVNPRGGAGAQTYIIEVLYVVSGILDISQGAVDLIL